MFFSEHCSVEYLKSANAVLIIWRKPCSQEAYRLPVRHALNLFKENPLCASLIVDARSGFEDAPEDVSWAFSQWMPQLAETGCRRFLFIKPPSDELETELDLWTKELLKYFTVSHVFSLEEAFALCRA
ncbi:MAG: hypothetical protein Q4G07_01805 [Oscillospiraceae bacterium]|nr:hypothetical protein [Oscillospiraceae bacterium]